MHVDGQAVRTCILPISAVAGKQVTTIEGLGTPDSPHPLQAAWASLSVPQCGYCQPGQIMSAAALLASNQNPSEDQVEQAMAKEGDLAAGFEVATAVVENDYWAPYLAHAPMEPMNAVAHVQGDHADVWCGTQGIGAAQKIVARLANLDIDKVRAHGVYLGGGFGRRATLTHVVEATQISLATGKPIQVLSSREDDLKSGVFRPASLMRIKAGVDQDGRISAWQAKRVGGNVAPGMLKVFLPAALHGQIDLDHGEVTQSNFHDYPILRMNEAPDVEVIIIDSDAHPTGVGEPGLPPIAPAVANAVYVATGQRLRSLPLRLR